MKRKVSSYAIARAKRTAFGRLLCRLAGDEKGAVAMEYIVIALLVAAAVVGLVMVFSGNLRNMLGTTNKVLQSKKVSEVEQAGTDYNGKQDTMAGENNTAQEAGDKLGGNFGNGSGGTGGGAGGGAGGGE